MASLTPIMHHLLSINQRFETHGTQEQFALYSGTNETADADLDPWGTFYFQSLHLERPLQPNLPDLGDENKWVRLVSTHRTSDGIPVDLPVDSFTIDNEEVSWREVEEFIYKEKSLRLHSERMVFSISNDWHPNTLGIKIGEYSEEQGGPLRYIFAFVRKPPGAEDQSWVGVLKLNAPNGCGLLEHEPKVERQDKRTTMMLAARDKDWFRRNYPNWPS